MVLRKLHLDPRRAVVNRCLLIYMFSECECDRHYQVVFIVSLDEKPRCSINESMIRLRILPAAPKPRTEEWWCIIIL